MEERERSTDCTEREKRKDLLFLCFLSTDCWLREKDGKRSKNMEDRHVANDARMKWGEEGRK